MQLRDLCGIQEIHEDVGHVYVLRYSNEPKFKENGERDTSYYIDKDLVEFGDIVFYSEEDILSAIIDLINEKCYQFDDNVLQESIAAGHILSKTKCGRGRRVENIMVYRGESEFDAGIIVAHNVDKTKWIYSLHKNWFDYYAVLVR